MGDYVTDTHALLWHISKDIRLSPTAKKIFEGADIGKETIFVPSIVLVECVYLAEKKRIDPERVAQVLERLSHPQYPYKLAHIDVDTILALKRVDRNKVPDMPDRIVAATALRFNIPLITKDGKIKDVPDLSLVW